MEGIGNLTEPQVDEVAARCVAQAQAMGRLGQYGLVVGNLPRLLHQHGLGQTLAYLQARGGGRSDSPYQLLCDHLSAWLAQAIGLPDRDALLGLTRSDSQVYRQAAEAARQLGLALRRAIDRATPARGGA